MKGFIAILIGLTLFFFSSSNASTLAPNRDLSVKEMSSLLKLDPSISTDTSDDVYDVCGDNLFDEDDDFTSVKDNIVFLEGSNVGLRKFSQRLAYKHLYKKMYFNGGKIAYHLSRHTTFRVFRI